MIFSKTDEECKKMCVKKYKKALLPKTWFAWRPVRIYLDGRWVWWEHVIRTKVTDSLTTYEICKSNGKENIKMQSRKRSLIESFTNIIVGFGISFGSVHYIFPLFGYKITLSDNLYMGFWFTIISLIRSYTLRRIFTRKD